jgi:hypothetical protein
VVAAAAGGGRGAVQAMEASIPTEGAPKRRRTAQPGMRGMPGAMPASAEMAWSMSASDLGPGPGPVPGTGGVRGRARPGTLMEKVTSPWDYHRKVTDYKKKQMREARDKAVAPETAMLRTKVLQPSSAGDASAGRLAPFESMTEAEELLRQFEPTESSSTRDPVFQATVKHSKEEWHAKLEKKADLQRMQDMVQEKWQEAHNRKATNTRMRDRLMLLALDLSRLQAENISRRKGLDTETKRRHEELARIQRDHSTVTLPVTCPEGVMAGHTLRVRSNGNRASMQDKQFDVVVPEGVMPGHRFNVQFSVPPQ